LEKVNEKIGGDAVIKLLLHKEGQENKSEVVLIRIALLYLGNLSNDPYECTSRFTIKDTVLSQEKQVELGQLLEPAINQFKQENATSTHRFGPVILTLTTGPARCIFIWIIPRILIYRRISFTS
jgi:hypothetical protein